MVQELKNMALDNFREKYDVVVGLYLDMLQHPGEQHGLLTVTKACGKYSNVIFELYFYTRPSCLHATALKMSFEARHDC